MKWLFKHIHPVELVLIIGFLLLMIVLKPGPDHAPDHPKALNFKAEPALKQKLSH